MKAGGFLLPSFYEGRWPRSGRRGHAASRGEHDPSGLRPPPHFVGRKWVCIAASLLLGLAACRDDGQEATPVRPVLSVAAIVRTTDTLGPFAGTIEPRYKADLGFRIFGRMVARFVDVGATVTKDQELAALDPAVQTLAERSAEATVANAHAHFVNARAEETRQR